MRFPRLSEAQWTKAQRKVAGEIAAGPRGQLRGPFVPLLHSPELASRIQKLGEYLRFDSQLPTDLIEIAILHIARHFECAHIWQSHREQALKARVPSAVIAAIAARELPSKLTNDQETVVLFCRDMLAGNKVSPAVFERAKARFGHKGVMDLTGVCGYYTMLAMVLNVAEQPLPEGSVPFAP